MDKEQKKALKRACKSQKKKYTLPWKITTIVAGVLAVVLLPVTLMLGMFDNTMMARMGGSFWTLENPDPTAIYYEDDFDTAEGAASYGLQLCKQVEAEGAALLLNRDKALPLAEGAKVSCFSTSSADLVYGGTGSGNIDASTADTLLTALEKCGIQVNPTLWDFYTKGDGKKYRRKAPSMFTKSGATLGEAPWSAYPQTVLDSVSDYGDAAIVVLSRVGGEGADLEYRTSNYLALDENEHSLLAGLAGMKADGSLKRLVVLINSANPLQMDFLQGNPYEVDACLWIGDVGISGINGVAEILAGVVNPSGSLVDTYCYDNYSAPAMVNFTPMTYEGYDGKIIPKNASTYMIYQEGIYVGYKYYETRYEDFVLGTGNAGNYDYDSLVAFPFGYGLSYTTFEYSNLMAFYDGVTGGYLLSLTVTNTGDVPGKEPVQIYAQAPYTEYDREHGVEKASVNLVGFAKTSLLAPGESESVQIAVDLADLASYDADGAGTYILDEGDYYLTAATDAHNAVNNILAAKGKMVDGNGELTCIWNLSQQDTLRYSISKCGAEVRNRLSDADPNKNQSVREEIVWLSRSDWEGTMPTETLRLHLGTELIDALQDVQYQPNDQEQNTAMPVLGAESTLKLYDLMGAEYSDPRWKELLNQLTFEEMVALIGDSFHWTMPVESINAPGTRDENGPQGLTASLFGTDSTALAATAFTSEDVMAATFNTDLMTEIGRVMGSNCLRAGVTVLYGPGNNIHRTPYGGRNFEYYSEDGFLSGKMSAFQVAAIQKKGVHVAMKHFALNDCEQDRIGLGVWLTEQAARELYLKAFQDPFEEGNAGGVMTAYTRWGTRWSGSNPGLMAILRQEWGSKGLTITDNVLTSYTNGVDGILAGGVSTFDAMLPYVLNQLPGYEDDPVVVAAMKEACHHTLYTVANSVAMNGIGPETTVKAVKPGYMTPLLAACAVLLLVTLLGGVKWILGARKLRRTEEYLAWKAARRQK